jgi:hypothetical protein
MQASTKLLTLLLTICSFSVPTALFLIGYFLLQQHEISELKAHLLSKNALQSQLLATQPLEKSVIPHLVNDIAFVLNPYMKKSAFKAYKGESYPVNSLGLRGKEINKKQAGVKRILIVGDSIVFGWKLKEKETLSSILNNYTKDLKQKFEFITIALPGWNIKSENAFLESHLRLLDPDLIIWWSIANDIEDVSGAIPPGYLAYWASPHAKDQSPFRGLSSLHKRSGSFMPTIAERRKENVETILSFREKYPIPIMLIDLPALQEHNNASVFDGQQLLIPKQYKQDKRWRLSISDGHPTLWANHIIAIGILSKLSRLEFISKIDFTQEEKKIEAVFKSSEIKKDKKENNSFSKILAQIPNQYESNNRSLAKSVLYGIATDGTMNRAGTLFLKNTTNSSYLLMRIESVMNIDKYPSTAIFTIRNQDYKTTQKKVKIAKKLLEIKLEIPINKRDFPIYEISWKFDFLLCNAPNACSVGKLLTAKFVN